MKSWRLASCLTVSAKVLCFWPSVRHVRSFVVRLLVWTINLVTTISHERR